MGISEVRVLVVDDFAPWHSFVCATLQKVPGLQIIGGVADGSEAIQRVRELQPDLVLLDVGLPTINGIEAAREMRELAPKSKILFVSASCSRDVVKEALRTGASGYVVKSTAATELLPAVEAVLQGKQFISAILAGHDFASVRESQAGNGHIRGKVLAPPAPRNVESNGSHEAQFYSDDASFLDDIVHFLGAALEAGNPAIVLATQSHRDQLRSGLRTYGNGVDVDAAVEGGRYVAVDATDAISNVMRGGVIDPDRFLRIFGRLIVKAAKTAKAGHARVAVFGECSQLLCAQGNVEAAIQLEKAASQLVKSYDVDLLCGYCLANVQDTASDPTFQQICAEHSAVYSI